MNPLGIFDGYLHTLLEVFTALAPLLVFFAVFQALIARRTPHNLLRISVGVVLAMVGLSLFLQGVEAGFLPFGDLVGSTLVSSSYRWALIPVGFLLGFVSIIAEPAVRVLNYEVEKVSSGSIKGRVLLVTLSIGVGFAVALAMTRVLYGIPLWIILVPGYLIAFALTRYSSESFVSIAFDSGGVATGPMTVTFILAMAVGAASGLQGRDPVAEGFGLVALVALAPILSVLTLGMIYRFSESRANAPKETSEREGERVGSHE